MDRWDKEIKLDGLYVERAQTVEKIGSLRARTDRSANDDDALNRLTRKAESLTDEIDGLVQDLAQEPRSGIARDANPPRSGRAGSVSGNGPRRAGLVLGREERMADWLENRGAVGSDFTRADAEDFSLGRAVRGMVRGDWADADLEKRALAEGVDATGGFLTPEVLSAQFIDKVRNKARVIESGATVVPMASDKHSIPRLSTGVTGAWKSENAPVSEEDPAFERVTFEAKTVAVLTKLSYELWEDAIPASADAIENDLIQALALKLDLAALRGSGTDPEPQGIRNQVGVNIEEIGSGNGVAPTVDDLTDAWGRLADQNFSADGFIYSARTARGYAKQKNGEGDPIQYPAETRDIPRLVSNQVPNNLTVGTSTDCSEIYTGQWDQLLIGARPQIGVRVASSSQHAMDTMSVTLLAWLRADIQLAHPEAFDVITGVRP